MKHTSELSYLNQNSTKMMLDLSDHQNNQNNNTKSTALYKKEDNLQINNDNQDANIQSIIDLNQALDRDINKKTDL